MKDVTGSAMGVSEIPTELDGHEPPFTNRRLEEPVRATVLLPKPDMTPRFPPSVEMETGAF